MTIPEEERVVTAKSIKDVYADYASIGWNSFNYTITLSVFSITAILQIISLFCRNPINEFNIQNIKLLSSILPTIMQVSAGIIGIWIAGFTIFVSFSRSKILVLMAKKKESKTGMNYLRYTFALFFGIVVHFITLLIISFLLHLSVSENGILSFLGAIEDDALIAIGNIITHSIVIFIATYSTFVFLLLKSVSFNLYNISGIVSEFNIVKHNNESK